ncbi:MAG TPA: ankyrin repeat domain-containing protein [Allosphingosinicella sp.]|nr:ankyrin repeat domain-containing protein [Allosphingosinicella sp.]
MPKELPARASLEWLKKSAKQQLKSRRSSDPAVKLADVQRDLARDHGFASWRKLKAHVERGEAAVPPSEEEVASFLRAVGTGDIESVRAALARRPDLVDATGPHPFWGGRPQALHVAVEMKRRELFDLLLDAGADVNGRNDQYDHWSPLMLTFSRDLPEMRAELLARGARVGLVDALLMGDDARVAGLLREGLPAIPNDGSILAFARTPFAIDRLLELGAPAELKDRWGSAPIDVMSRLGAEGRPLVAHMIRRGVSASPEDHARLGDRERLEAMVAERLALARSDAVLMAAVDSGDCGLVGWLIGLGANPNARATRLSRQTALHSAAWNGDLAMARLLVEAGADIDARDGEHDSTPAGWAETSVTITNNARCAEMADWLRSLPGGG